MKHFEHSSENVNPNFLLAESIDLSILSKTGLIQFSLYVTSSVLVKLYVTYSVIIHEA